MRAAALLCALILVPGSSWAAAAAKFDKLIASGDIVFSPRAAWAPAVSLLERPERHAAGVSVDAKVAGYYENGSSLEQGNSHHQGKEENNDNGNKTGHVDSNAAEEIDSPRVANELVLNNEFAQGLDHWSSHSAFTTSQFGPIVASAQSADGVFAAVHTGWSYTNDHGFIEQQVTVPMARNAVFSMLYNFVSAEYPVWVGTEFNDRFEVTIQGPSGEKTFDIAQFLNTSQFSAVSGLPEGVMDGWPVFQTPVTGGQTGWQTMNSGSLALKNGVYRLRIEVNDVTDDIVDSAILVDRVSLK